MKQSNITFAFQALLPGGGEAFVVRGKRMKKYCLVVLMALAGAVWGQPPDTVWTYAFSTPFNDESYCVSGVSDGGFIVAGRRGTVDSGYVALAIKLDDSGHEDWVQTYSSFTRVNSVVEASDGGFALTGGCRSGSVNIIKTDSTGSIQWSRCIVYIEPQEGKSVVETMDRGFALLTDGNDTPNPGIILLRFNSEGDSLWSRSYGGSQIDYGGGVSTTMDGGFVLCGSISLQAVVIKTDSVGGVEWWTDFGDDHLWERPDDIIIRSDGNYMIAGFQQRESWQWNPYVACLSPNGDTLWTRTYPDLGPVAPHCKIVELSNGILALGICSGENIDFVVIYLDANGSILSTASFGTPITDVLHGMCITIDNGLVLAGDNHTNVEYSSDIWAVRTETILSIDLRPTDVITDFTLMQNFPNPFNATSTLVFLLPQTSPVSLSVFNLLGQAVYEADLGRLNAGEHRHLFDARELPSGVYVARVTAGEVSQMRKMVLLK